VLQDYKSQEGCRLELDWDGWIFTASLNSDEDAFGLHDQDCIYNSKKLISRLFSSIQCMQLRGDVCLLQHVGDVYNRFSVNEYGHRQEDVDRKDK